GMIFVCLCDARWWARQDSKLQPDRFERSALTIELQAQQWRRISPPDCVYPIQCEGRGSNVPTSGSSATERGRRPDRGPHQGALSRAGGEVAMAASSGLEIRPQAEPPTLARTCPRAAQNAPVALSIGR